MPYPREPGAILKCKLPLVPTGLFQGLTVIVFYQNTKTYVITLCKDSGLYPVREVMEGKEEEPWGDHSNILELRISVNKNVEKQA